MSDNTSTSNDNSENASIVNAVLMELRSLTAQISAVDSSLTAQISAVDNRLNSRLDDLDREVNNISDRVDMMGRKITDINDRVDMMGRKITDINDRVDMMGRRVIANETRPSIRVATPRTYHSATEMQSVTAPIRRRIGFYGR